MDEARTDQRRRRRTLRWLWGKDTEADRKRQEEERHGEEEETEVELLPLLCSIGPCVFPTLGHLTSTLVSPLDLTKMNHLADVGGSTTLAAY